MSLISFIPAARFPETPGPQAAIYTSSLTLDASDEKVAFVFTIPKSGTISKLGFRTGTVTTAQTLRVGLYTVDSSGNPTTTQYGSSAYGTQSSPASNTAYTVSLATPATATRGDKVAIVIEYDSTAGSLAVFCQQYGYNNYGNYLSEFKDPTWTKSTKNAVHWIEYSDGSYYPITWFAASVMSGNYLYNSGSSPDEYGIKVRMPFSGLLYGVGINIYGAMGDYSIKVYDEFSNLLGSQAYGGYWTSIGSSIGYAVIIFASPIKLRAGRVYRVTMMPDSATNVRLYYATILPATAAGMDGWSGGQDVVQTSRTDGGAWTDDSTTRPHIHLLLYGLGDEQRFSRIIRP